MPSASTIYAAWVSLREHNRRAVESGPKSAGVQAARHLRVKRAEESLRELEPLVGEEAERLAAEARGYVERSTEGATA